jgi:hypothetical protein
MCIAMRCFRLTGRGWLPVDPESLPLERISGQDHSPLSDVAMEAFPVDVQARHVKFGERVENLGPVLGTLA